MAIGYPDVVSIANTTLNQTGRAVECIAIIMLVYLSTSLEYLGADELVQQARGDHGTLKTMADTFQPVAPRPAPVRTEGFVPWVKRNLFADWKNGLTTVLLVALALALLPAWSIGA